MKTENENIEIECEKCGKFFEPNDGYGMQDLCNECRGWNDDDELIFED